MARSRHSKREIERALKCAENATPAWTVVMNKKGYRWGRMLCPAGCCLHGIWSTPKSPQNHAKWLVKQVDTCPTELAAAAARAQQEEEDNEEGDA